MSAPLAAGEPPEGWLRIPDGAFAMGAAAEGFAYDNERPRHSVALPAFTLARRPVSNRSWMRFSEGGGYERREWWSREGWAWKEEHDITRHPSVSTGHPEAPVCHVSWFEADAFARAHDARLPTEAEWERAVTWTQRTGDELAGIGRAWEWTASHFHGYPGFVAHPYREYSQVFFGTHYRVLRGSSWATAPARREHDLSQLGSAAAAPDLRRCTPCKGGADGAVHATAAAHAEGDPHRLAPRRNARTLARRRRARRPHAPVQGAAAQALLRRPRSRAVRPDLRPARVLPDARRARDPRGAGRAAGAADRRGRARRARLGHGRQDARAARRAAGRRNARALHTGGRHREHGARLRAGAHRASTPGCACTA